MTRLDLKTIDAALTARARELARTLAARNQIAIQTSAEDVENTVLAREREFSAQALSKDMRLLREIEAARKRLRDGVYGICLQCEEEIAPKRLLAIPWTAYCVSCKARLEGPGRQLARDWMRAA
jgi:DnaK suppressor protein